jgi:hypothetical protein
MCLWMRRWWWRRWWLYHGIGHALFRTRRLLLFQSLLPFPVVRFLKWSRPISADERKEATSRRRYTCVQSSSISGLACKSFEPTDLFLRLSSTCSSRKERLWPRMRADEPVGIQNTTKSTSSAKQRGRLEFEIYFTVVL